MSRKQSKILIIGIDGGDPDLIFSRYADVLPNINGIAGGGEHGILRSTIPSATIPAWNSFYTGFNPGAHGLYDFTSPPDFNYSLRFLNSRDRNIPAFWARASRRGKKCAVLNFPSCYPPEQVNGVMISGFDCPLPSGGDRSFIYPMELYDEIIKHFGPYRISGFDQIDLSDENMRKASVSLLETAEYKGNVGEWLLTRQEWDLFMIHFGEVDAACHHFWRFCDVNSPRRIGNEGDKYKDTVKNVYGKIDEQVGKLTERIDESWAVILMSDHGFRGTGTNVLHINNLLRDAGLLKYRKSGFIDDKAIKYAARLIPSHLRKYFFRGKLSELTNRIEGMRRFGNIDLSETMAFSEELNYFPSIRLNLKGKYRNGTIGHREKEKILTRVIDILDNLQDQEDNPAIDRIYRREEIYSGKFTSQAPEIVFELNAPGGYTNGVLPSMIEGPALRKLETKEYPGGKGSFPCGGHRREGFYTAMNFGKIPFENNISDIFDLYPLIDYILRD
ncbi:MAG: hypothetical protein GF307_09190 [candidate division Zixibacteria bacterium]|nr:hypothetical protein [candidate division Zixibacteria bacterium]